MSMRPTNSATLPLRLSPSAFSAAAPAARPASVLFVPTYAMRFDLGASESWQMTGIFSATRSSSGVIDSGFTGLTAMPSKPSTITSSM